MKSAAVPVVSVFAVVLLADAALGQVYQPVGRQLCDVSAALTDINGKSVVFQSTDPKEKEPRLFYHPFFALEEEKPGSGRPKVTVQKSSTEGQGIVTITLLFSPQNKVDAIAKLIRSKAEMKAVDARYARLENVNLIGLPLANLTVMEAETRYGFRPVTFTKFAAQGVLDLTVELPMEKAKALKEGIEKGEHAVPQFSISYDLSTDQELSQTDIQTSIAYLYETKVVKDLLASKDAREQFGWKVGGDGVKLNQPFLTRSQRQQFEGRAKAEVVVTVRIGNEKDAEFVKQMQRYFDAVFQKSAAIDTDTTPLGRELQRLSSYGLDPDDLKADKVDELVAKVKDFFSQDDADKKTFEAGASASFLGIGGSGSVKTSGESLRKSMRDKGWEFQVKGKFSVPKSFEVHILDNAKLKTNGVVSGTIIRAKRGFTGFEHRVSASSLYHPTSTKDEVVEVAELRAKVARLRSHFDAMCREPLIGGGESKEPNQVYTAPSDGFVTVVTVQGAVGFHIQTDGNGDAPINKGPILAGALSPNQSGMAPIRKGQKWQVRALKVEKGKTEFVKGGTKQTGIYVGWVPIRLTSPAAPEKKDR